MREEREDLRIRNLSPKTEDCYVWHVEQFARHFGKSPADLAPEHVRQCQLHLIEHIPHAKREKKLPVVLSPGEVCRVLEAVANQKHCVLLSTICAAGLRLGEATRLRVADVDSARMVLQIPGSCPRQGV